VVVGCRSQLLPGATLQVWNSSSKTVSYGAATTNSSGQATVLVPGNGSYYAEVTHPRFVTHTRTFNATTCPSTTQLNVNLTVAAGYACIPQGTACATPASATLYLTTSFGTAVLTYNPSAPGGAAWAGSLARTYTSGCGAGCDTPSYPGSGAFNPPYASTVSFFFRGGALTIAYFQFAATFRSSWGIPNGCPKPDGYTAASEQVSAFNSSPTSYACPPSLAASGPFTFFSPGSCFMPASGTWSLTE